jgi:hypothetical protein
LNEYKVWYCLLPAGSYHQVSVAGLDCYKSVGVGGLFLCVGYPLPSVIEEKGEGFETEKFFGFVV